MVGFKFITLGAVLITSMVITGCVPQAKQTQCKAEEAFNPIQRRCLPINPSETSFIKIRSAVPTSGITQTASSGSDVNFTIMVENPYKRKYRIKWLRNFNGAQSTLVTPGQPSSNITDHLYHISLVPKDDLFEAVGRHIITAQILEENSNNVVDSHDFSLELTNDPTPSGQGFTPGLSSPINYNPINTVRTFSFNVERNNRLMNTPMVRWRLTKLTEPFFADLEEVIPLNQTINSQPVSFLFNPSNPFKQSPSPTAPFLDHVGNYRLEASIMDGSSNFSTYSWEITIHHPSLGVVSEASLPFPENSLSTIRAFNGVAYSNTTPSNFTYQGTRGQFCVKVSDPDGRYGDGVIVRFYKGNEPGAEFFDTTNASKDTICLEDAPPADKDKFVFSDANPDLIWSSSITAKVFDAQTNEEYTTFSGGPYPLVWSVVVEPRNKAPELTFADVAGSVNCSSINSTGTVRSGCKVIQDQSPVNKSFVIAFNVADEHYSGTDLDERIAYQGILTRGATPIESTSCVKNFSDYGTNTDNGVDNIDDFQGPTFTCRFNVPAADDLGSINPIPQNWKVSVNVNDNGSPYTTTQKSASLVWELDVTELNTSPTPTIQVSQNVADYTPITTARETDTIVFTVNYSDLERDPYTIELYRCEDETICSESLTSLKTVPLVSYSSPDWAQNRRMTFTIPDGFVPDEADPVPVRFRVRVIDSASTTTAVDAFGVITPKHVVDTFIPLHITNHNPAPVFATPNALGQYNVFGTVPLKLDPGDVTDDSIYTNANEAQIDYQWSIATADIGPWTSIQGATSRILTWTPGKEIISGNYYIRLCVTDNSPVNTALICNTPAEVKAENHFSLSNPIYRIGSFEQMWGSPAVWIDNSSTTSIPSHLNSKVIYAAFAVRETDGAINTNIRVVKYFLNSDNQGRLQKLGEITFPALDPAILDQPRTMDVQDISIVGDDHSLYIAYMAQYETSNVFDEGGRPEIRRIRKDFNTIGSKTSTIHPAPFGFSYDGFFVRSNCVACLTVTQVTNGETQFDFNSISIYPVTLDLSPIGFSDPDDYITLTSTPTINSPLAHAQDLANQINNSTDPLLMGITAEISGTNLIIRGPLANDYFRVNQIALKVGKLNISNGKVILPFINASTGAPQGGTISVVKFTSDDQSNLETIFPTLLQTNLLDTHASDLDNTIDRHGNLLIGYVSTSDPGVGKLLVLPGAAFGGSLTAHNIITTAPINKIRISGSNTDNVNNFAIGRSGNNKLHMASFEIHAATGYDPTSLANWNMSAIDGVVLSDNTFARLNSFTNVWDFSINAAVKDDSSLVSHEARILVASDQGIFAFKALPDNTVTCGDCLTIGKDNIDQPDNVTTPPLVVRLNKRLAVSQIVPNVLIGSAGNSGGTENNASMMSFAYIGEDIASGNGIQNLYMGVINTNKTSVNSTTHEAIGYYGPSIFKK